MLWSVGLGWVIKPEGKTQPLSARLKDYCSYQVLVILFFFRTIFKTRLARARTTATSSWLSLSSRLTSTLVQLFPSRQPLILENTAHCLEVRAALNSSSILLLTIWDMAESL